MVKSLCCSCRRPKFGSQHPYWVVHNCLWFPIQGTWWSLVVFWAPVLSIHKPSPPPNIHKDKISLKQTNMCLGKTSRRKHSFHNANCEDMEGHPRFSDWENSIVAVSSKVSYAPDAIRIEIRTLFFTGKATSKLTSKHGKPWVVKNKRAEQKK